MKVPFVDFKMSNYPLKAELLQAMEEVMDSNWFILGNKVKLFEQEYAQFNEIAYCIGVGNGLDALHIALKCLDIKEGDEVIVPSNTYIATLLAVSFTGAKPIMVEPNEKTYNINPNAIEAKITQKTKAIMPVHLYGQACEMDKIMLLAKKYNLYVVEDNAQSQGAIFKDKLTGSWGDINGTSFYPGKNLGAFGDAGAITTNSELLDSNARIWRNYGSEKKYYNEVQGFNSRLDEIQASFLSVKLKHLNTWTIERQKIAQHYHENLKNCDWIELPTVHPDASHVYHLFVIRTKYRYQLQQYLEQNGIGTLIHYPVPPHLQKAYIDLAHKKDDFPIAEALAEECLSLPMFVGLTNEQIEYVCNKIKSFGHEYL